MNWLKNPKATEIVKKYGLIKKDVEIAEILKTKFPEERITWKGVQHQRQQLRLLKPKDFLTVPTSETKDKEEKDSIRVLGWLQQESLSVGELSRRLDRSKESIIKIIDELRAKGFEVKLEEETHQVSLTRELRKEFKPIKLESLYRRECKIMKLADTHLCSRFQQLSLLHTAYKIAEQEKVDFAIHYGDLGDGMGLYRGHEQEIFIHGADEQTEYIIENYPCTKRFKTYIIPGSHDLIWLKKFGYNILKNICHSRADLVYTPGERQFRIKGLTFETLHPSGGIPYAQSYRLQKLIQGAIGDLIVRIRARQITPEHLPQFYGAGHLHVALWMSYLGFQAYMVPSFQAQTPYLRDKGLFPQVGFFIIKVKFDGKGNVTKLSHDYYDFTSQVKKHDY